MEEDGTYFYSKRERNRINYFNSDDSEGAEMELDDCVEYKSISSESESSYENLLTKNKKRKRKNVQHLGTVESASTSQSKSQTTFIRQPVVLETNTLGDEHVLSIYSLGAAGCTVENQSNIESAVGTSNQNKSQTTLIRQPVLIETNTVGAEHVLSIDSLGAAGCTVENPLNAEQLCDESRLNIKFSDKIINSLLKDGELDYKKVNYTFKNGVKRAVSSPVWNQFFQIYDVKSNNDIKDWYICVICNEVFENNHGGTTTLFLRHMKRCTTIGDGQKTLDKFLPLNRLKKAKISEKHVEQVKEAAVRFVCDDLRPFSAVELAGMHNFLLVAIELGQNYPNLPKESLLAVIPKRSTVQRSIEKKVIDVKEMLTKKLRLAIETCGGFGCTVDLWTDNFRQKSYLAGTVHLNRLENSGIVHERFVFTMTEVEEEIKSKEVIESKIFASFRELGLTSEEIKTKIRFVTDRGSQFKAMDSIQRANCSAHMFNNVVKCMCVEPTVKKIIEDSKSLVTYMKRSGLNFKHNISLKGYCETRWNTVFIMLESILVCYQTVFAVLERRQKSGKRDHRNCIKRIECIKKSCLQKLVDFLRPFKEWSDRLEADKQVTINQVWPTFIQLNDYLNVSIHIDDEFEDDSDMIKNMKTLGLNYVTKIFNDITPNEEQRMAVVLHPKMKKLRRMNSNERQAGYELVDNVVRAETAQLAVEPQLAQQQMEIVPQKRSSMAMDDFLDSEDEQIDSTFSPELARYLDEKIADDVKDIREWWFKNRNRYKVLFKLFLRISATPASSAPAERTFSTAGAVITDRRSSLLPSSVSNIMMCRNLYRS